MCDSKWVFHKGKIKVCVSCSWQCPGTTALTDYCFLCQDDDIRRKPNRKQKFSFFLDNACDERTKPLVQRYIELLVRSSQVCFRTYKNDFLRPYCVTCGDLPCPIAWSVLCRTCCRWRDDRHTDVPASWHKFQAPPCQSACLLPLEGDLRAKSWIWIFSTSKV